MSTPLRRLARLVLGGHPPARMLDGFVDSLIQSFENCRPGLADEALGSSTSVEEFFARIYEKEKPRLVEMVQIQYSHLSDDERQAFVEKIDGRVHSVVIPAYSRIAARFAARERNDFYLARGAWHGLERLGFSAAGLLLGAFIVWAPFIPLNAKEWVFVFGLGGLVFPDLRRVFAWKRYESELNDVVGRTDDEIFRMDMDLLTHETPHAAAPLIERKEDPNRTPPRTREGGR